MGLPRSDGTISQYAAENYEEKVIGKYTGPNSNVKLNTVSISSDGKTFLFSSLVYLGEDYPYHLLYESGLDGSFKEIIITDSMLK